jgi:hypothetical protein
VARRLEHRPKVRSELRGHAQIRLLAEQDVLAVPIEPRELTEQVAEVRPDAEIMELARIDRDSHPSAL